MREELEKELSQSGVSTKELILKSKNYPIRNYTDSLADNDREKAIKAIREALPTHKGVSGECRSYEVQRMLLSQLYCRMLSILYLRLMLCAQTRDVLEVLVVFLRMLLCIP